jgi:hypothetical protein
MISGVVGGLSRKSAASVLLRNGARRDTTPFGGITQVRQASDGLWNASQFPDPGEPSRLFSNGESGAWFDPNDLSTMFQDAAGLVPVTGIGQPIRLWRDKSGNGNNVTAASDAQRPTLEARANLLIATDTLSTQSVTIGSATAHTLSFEGTGTVTLTGASTAGPLIGTGATDRVSLTFTPTTGTLTLTVSGDVFLAQLELGSLVSTYQAVVDASNYNDIGLPRYVQFDGVDDRLSGTLSIASGRVTMIASAQKTTDAQPSLAVGIVVTIGDLFLSFPAAFIQATSTGFGVLQYLIANFPVSATAPSLAPARDVFTGLVNTIDNNDGAGFQVSLRKNGALAASAIGRAQDTPAAFLFSPFAIGSRVGGSNRHYLGRVYAIALREGTTDNLTAISVERSIGQAAAVAVA